MSTTIPGSGSFLLKIRNEPSVASACDMAACGRECVTFGGKTVIVTPELKLFPRTFTRKGLPHSEFKSRLDGHRRPISGPPRAGLRPFLRPIPGINYCSLSGRCLWAWELECSRLHGAQCTGRIPRWPGVGEEPGPGDRSTGRDQSTRGTSNNMCPANKINTNQFYKLSPESLSKKWPIILPNRLNHFWKSRPKKLFHLCRSVMVSTWTYVKKLNKARSPFTEIRCCYYSVEYSSSLR